MSKDDQYWHSVMIALGNEFIQHGRAANDPKTGGAWVAAGKEVKATADEALRLSELPERLVEKH